MDWLLVICLVVVSLGVFRAMERRRRQAREGGELDWSVELQARAYADELRGQGDPRFKGIPEQELVGRLYESIQQYRKERNRALHLASFAAIAGVMAGGVFGIAQRNWLVAVSCTAFGVAASVWIYVRLSERLTRKFADQGLDADKLELEHDPEDRQQWPF